jgi:putative transposase
MGITQTGYKEILGFYASESEGAHFWLTVLNDLKAKGVQIYLLHVLMVLMAFLKLLIVYSQKQKYNFV